MRRADCDEDSLALAGSLSEIGGKADLGISVALEKLGEVRLVDEGVTSTESGDFALVVVDADDVVSHLGEADGGDQANIA